MRNNEQNAGAKEQRLELLAEHFLRMTGQKRQSESNDGIEIGNDAQTAVTVTM
jgi:hypothetical protein